MKLVTPFSNEWYVATMDGATHALNRDIDPEILRRLIIINDGEQTPPLKDLAAPLRAETPEEKALLSGPTRINFWSPGSTSY